MSANSPSLDPAGIVGTTVAHGALLAVALFLAHTRHESPNTVYAVDILAAPLPAAAPRRAAQEALPTKAEETVPLKPKPTPKPPPKKEPPKPVENAKPAETPPPVTKTPAVPAPGETPSTGQNAVTVQKTGLQFPYPEYLAKIYDVIGMRWQRPLSSLRVEIGFTILKDGSVKDITVLTRSGNSSFDQNAQAAVESAGNARAFGPLPSGFPGTELPISFTFSPAARRPQ